MRHGRYFARFTEDLRMQLKVLVAVVAAAFILTACNKAETPAEVARDVEKAQAEGKREVADARADVCSKRMRTPTSRWPTLSPTTTTMK